MLTHLLDEAHLLLLNGALVLISAGVVSWNEGNPGIFLWASCMVAICVVAYLAIVDV